MKRNLLIVNSTASSGAVTEQRIGNHDYYVVSGAGSIVGNTVMNGIYYPLDEVKKLAASNVGRIPAPVSHPKDENGNLVSAYDQVAQNDFGIGAFSFNYRMSGDRLVRDIAVPKTPSMNSDKHAAVISRIENALDMDTSTGVIYSPVDGSGVGKDGEEYDRVAVNMSLDHDALLPFEIGASTTLMGTGLFANSDGNKSEVVEYNASMPALNLPLAPLDTSWDSQEADKLIREYTESSDAPSSTYRRYFLYFDRDSVDNFTSYKLPFATIIDGRPHAVLNAINNASSRLEQTQGLSDTDKSRAKRVIESYQAKAERMRKDAQGNSMGLFARAWNSIKSAFAKNELSHDQVYSQISDLINAELSDANKWSRYPCDIYQAYFIYRDRSDDMEKYYKQDYHITTSDKVEFDGAPIEVERVVEYKTVTQTEGNSMDKLKAALNSAGVNTDGMNDDAVLAAYNKMIVANAAKEGGSMDDESEMKENEKEKASNSSEIPEWFKPFASQLSVMNASSETKLNDAAKKVAALNMGISEDAAKAMGLNACEQFLEKNKGIVNFSGNGAGFGIAVNAGEDQFDMTKLGDE